MDSRELHDHLGKLQDEFKASPGIDARAHELLDELRGEVSQGTSADASVSDRLEQLAVQFEVAHPGLAASSRRLVALLNDIGL